MLKSVHLQNFRGFKDHILPFRPNTIIVGANNVGKSTLVEALRLLSLVANRYRYLSYSKPPPEADLPMYLWVVSPSLENFDVNFDNLNYELGDPPAVITAEFTSGEVIELYLVKTKRLYAVIRDSSEKIIRSKHEASLIDIGEIHILPQVAPFSREEVILSEKYVRQHITSPLAPLHFRNQLLLFPDEYARFRDLAAQTWSGLSVQELLSANGFPGESLSLLVKDGNFTGEVAWMGHGLQMWLQTIWFLARTPETATVILDEPDVYLHPDLQRRMLRLIHSSYKQVIVTTHSIEIMSESDPSDILVINRTRSDSKFADDHATVQKLVDHIGSSQNINLARLHATKRFLLIEGNDSDYLNHFHELIFKNSSNPLASLPHLSLGGWGAWDYAIGSRMTQNYLGEQIISYCIFDSDYHTPKQIIDRYNAAKKLNINLHVWSKKEIENYLLIPSGISRVIRNRIKSNLTTPEPKEVAAQIDKIAAELKDEVSDNFGNEFLNDERAHGLSAANKKARSLVDNGWQTPEGRRSLVSGKQVLSKLSDWSQKSYNVAFGPMTILRELKAEEVPEEVVDVIRAIENGNSLATIRAKYQV